MQNSCDAIPCACTKPFEEQFQQSNFEVIAFVYKKKEKKKKEKYNCIYSWVKEKP